MPMFISLLYEQQNNLMNISQERVHCVEVTIQKRVSFIKISGQMPP